MKKIKLFCKKIFCLPPFATVIIAVPSFVFVIFVLIYETKKHTSLSYAAYLLSAYALNISITGTIRAIRIIKKTGKEKANSLKLVKKIRSNPIGDKLLSNSAFRSIISLHGGMAINLIYAITNGYSGIRNNSAWSISLAFYYLLLSVMKIILVKYSHKKDSEKDIISEYRQYRTIGIILLLMNQALAAMVVYMAYKNKGSVYSGLMIYWMATYTFYITISAIVNAISCRKKNSPVLSAAKIISLTASLVSMLSLETAMLTQFHDESEDPHFRQIMVGSSGGAVCVLVLSMAIFMIAKSTKYLHMRKEMLHYEAEGNR